MVIELEESVKKMGDKQLADAIRALCRTDLKYLCKQMLGYRDWDECHDELGEWFKASKKPYKLILLPREHLKTSIITIGRTIQEILKNPNITILLVSAVWDNARTFLSEIKQHLRWRGELQELFGRFGADFGWNRDEITICQRTAADKTPTIVTGGVDGTLVSQHYDLIVVDDIVNRQTVSTTEQMGKTLKFFSDLFDLTKRPNGQIIFVGTRWHDADIYGEIMRDHADEFDVYVRGATVDGTVDGKVIFPKKFTNDKLKELLRLKGSTDFSAQYFNNAIPLSSQHFKPPVRYWQNIDNAVHYLTIDPAISQKEDSCDAVVLHTALTVQKQLAVIEYDVFKEERKHPSFIIDSIFRFVERNKIKRVGIEAVGYQEVLCRLVDDEKRKRGSVFEIVPIRQKQDKFSRILELQAWWERGDLLLKQGMVELEEQIFRFPIAHKNDIVDALAMVLQISNVNDRPINGMQAGWIPPRYRTDRKFKGRTVYAS